MPVRLDHVAVAAHDRYASARFLADIMGLPDPAPAGFFLSVHVGPDMTLQYAEPGVDFPGQHYAFLVSDDEFDAILGRIRDRGVDFWADPGHRRAGEINRENGGRGLYFDDPSGHHLEILTRRCAMPEVRTAR